MDNSTIGIKVADGTYFPILEEERTGKKKLVLTTVNDDQASVQIDLYKGEGQELNDALYIGSLVIEDIMPAMKGDPEIELLIGIDSDGNLNAEAGDTATSERQSLSVSLESLDDGDFSSPNFELDDQGFDEIPSLDEEPALDDGSSFDEEPA
ncbi:MAG TPA: peptidoglycan-binding protein, partial [Spirochaeta sp.]|nr:peptidoglycan-binding protein [Spirochaeta sp.]